MCQSLEDRALVCQGMKSALFVPNPRGLDGGCVGQAWFWIGIYSEILIMGACCSKFGSYLIGKEVGKTCSNGGTPRLNKLEHKQSFVSSPNKSNSEGKEDQEKDPSSEP